MDPEFDEQLRKQLQEAAESVIPKRHARRHRKADTMPKEDENFTPYTGKNLTIVFPHNGWRPVIRLASTWFRMSQGDFITMILRTGLIAIMEGNPAFSEAMRNISPSLWEELDELREAENAEDEPGRKGRLSA